MKYTIILPNGQRFTIERVVLRFESNSAELIVYGANEVGGEESILGMFPIGTALIDGELLSKDILEYFEMYEQEKRKVVEKENEIYNLKNRTLWQRILNK